MMNEEIIIDGVDISHCEFLLRACKNTKEPTAICKVYEYCDMAKYCYYKQLVRQMKENKKLKDKQQIRKLIYSKLETSIDNIDSLANKINEEIIEYRRVLKEMDGE